LSGIPPIYIRQRGGFRGNWKDSARHLLARAKLSSRRRSLTVEGVAGDPPGQIGGIVARVWRSRHARDATMLVGLNSLARVASFFGAAYAARCLGPANLGLSGLVQATAQQASLTFNGGFDTVAVRRIAAEQERARQLAGAVVWFRAAGFAIVASVWFALTLLLAPPSQRGVWLLGIPLLAMPAFSLLYAFQGLERLPLQNAVTAGLTVVSAAAYLVFFRPGMRAGADLVVIGSVAIVGLVFSWALARPLLKGFPSRPSRAEVWSLLREAWPYWLLAVAVWFYANVQLPIVALRVGKSEAGLYRAAISLSGVLELLFASINSLLLPRFVQWNRDGLAVLWRRQGKLLALYAALGAGALAVALLISPHVLPRLLGPAFAGAVPLFGILAASRVVVFCGQIYSNGLAATGHDGRFLGASLAGVVVGLPGALLLSGPFGAQGAAYAALAAEIVVVSMCYFFMRQVVTRASS
jgi:O-antigen/teichoic acid export membrane protein